MREDTVVQLRQPGSFEDDPLTEVLRLGARRLLGQAVAAEVAGFVEAYAHLTDSAGRRRIVRHGHLPEREIQTGIGPVAVRCPRVRDRGAGETGPRVRFTSRILPPYLSRAKSIEELLPWLYLKGISTGDFCEALAALLGPEAPGLSASTIARLKEVWQGELEHWQRRDLSAKCYGAKCCSISSAAAWRLRPSWPPATGRSVSGKPCARSTGRRASSAVGCTRPPTCSTSSRSPSSVVSHIS